MFHKILIANRGEIAVRIIRACRELGIKTVAVYSDVDREALHTQLADESICIGPASSLKSYLNMEQIISATIITKADAIHPGFGFLSENAKFAAMCEKCNIKFIGPSSDVISHMGNKARARQTMMEANIPVIPGSEMPVFEAEEAKELADQIGYPIMVKASSGGGGKGMRIVEKEEDFIRYFHMAQQEAINAFGDNTMYMEKYIVSPRHIEFQILADHYGNVIHLGERDCSIQRRHQKMIEESPSSIIKEELRKKMGEVAIAAAQTVGYESAGTVEFLLDHSGNFYFMEMNTRIQVEHPVTEMVSGLDLIKEQIRIAEGETLSYTQKDITLQGHAIECRINAENPSKNFMPSPGIIKRLLLPGGNGVRIDTAVYQDYEIPPYYDSMILKIIVHDKTRTEAIRKMQTALGEVIVEGVDTNLDFLYEIICHEKFISGDISTSFLQDYFKE